MQNGIYRQMVTVDEQAAHGHKARGEPTYAELQAINVGLLAALELMAYGHRHEHQCDCYKQVDAAIAKAKRLSTPTGNPKYPDSLGVHAGLIGYCEDSDSLHECGRDRSVVGIHECGLPGCHLPSDSGDIA